MSAGHVPPGVVVRPGWPESGAQQIFHVVALHMCTVRYGLGGSVPGCRQGCVSASSGYSGPPSNVLLDLVVGAAPRCRGGRVCVVDAHVVAGGSVWRTSKLSANPARSRSC